MKFCSRSCVSSRLELGSTSTTSPSARPVATSTRSRSVTPVVTGTGSSPPARSTTSCASWSNVTNLTNTYQAITPDINVADDGHVFVVWQNHGDSTFKIAGSADAAAIAEGMRMTFSQLAAALKDEGLEQTPVESGQERGRDERLELPVFPESLPREINPRRRENDPGDDVVPRALTIGPFHAFVPRDRDDVDRMQGLEDRIANAKRKPAELLPKVEGVSAEKKGRLRAVVPYGDEDRYDPVHRKETLEKVLDLIRIV